MQGVLLLNRGNKIIIENKFLKKNPERHVKCSSGFFYDLKEGKLLVAKT